MQRLEVSGAVRPLWWPLGVKGLMAVCLFSEQQVAGWGLDEFGMTADKLKMVEMPVVARDTCLKSSITFFSVFTHETTFCAGFRNGTFRFRL
jgi:hypothetical protein